MSTKAGSKSASARRERAGRARTGSRGSRSGARTSLITKHKKAYFDYEVVEKLEAGIILTGAEVKSIKGGGVQLKGSYVSISGGKVMTEKMHISPYRQSAAHREGKYDPLRSRELLLHRKEIDNLSNLSTQKGFTIIPLEVLLKNNFVKMVIGVCRGKKAHDKRDVLKRRAETKEVNQALKKFNR